MFKVDRLSKVPVTSINKSWYNVQNSKLSHAPATGHNGTSRLLSEQKVQEYEKYAINKKNAELNYGHFF